MHRFILLLLISRSLQENEDISSELLQKTSPGFFFTIPKTVTAGRNETVCVSLHSVSPPSKVLVDLKVKEKHHVVSRNLDSEHTCFELPIPTLNYKEPHFASVQVQVMLNGTIESARNQDPILIYPDKEITFIETDRGIYKPGDRVKMRILVLTQEMMSIKNYKIPTVRIKNPMDVTVSIWTGVMTDLGLVQLEYQLSQETVEGKWTIEANGELKLFEVRKHVLPRFKVSLNYPKIIYTGGTYVTFEICAKYFFGEQVKGSALIKISDSAHNLKPLTRMKRMEDGCAEFTFSNEDLYLHNLKKPPTENQIHLTQFPAENTKKLNVVGLVTETGTNQVEIEEGHCTFTFNAYEMKFVLESPYFQPGLPFRGKLQLSNVQEKLTKEVIEICYTIAVKRSWNVQQVNPCTNFTVGVDNSVQFSVLPFRSNVVQFYLAARSLNHTNVKFSGPVAVLRLHSPSGSYVKIEHHSEYQTSCKAPQHFTVYYTTDKISEQNNLTFYYMIKSRNKIYKLRKITRYTHKHVPNYLEELENIVGTKHKFLKLAVSIDKFALKFKLDDHIVSKYKLLVYYVLPNGETVASSKEISLDACLPNKVETRWSETHYSPDETAILIIKTAANSLCSVTSVDKSTKYISESKIFNLQTLLKPFLIETEPKESDRLTCIHHTKKESLAFFNVDPEGEETVTSEYDLRRRKRHAHSFAEDFDAYNVLSQFGVNVVTNLRIITKPCYDGPVYHENEYDSDSVQFYTKHYDVNDDKSVPLRTYFPETWLWELVFVSKDGEAEVTRQVPHSLTTWIGNTLCVSPNLGVGLSEISEVTVFQPFFLNVLTPYSIKRGEILYLYVKLFNYLQYNLPIQITLMNSDGLEFLDRPNAPSRCISAQENVDYVYRIKGTKLGKLNVTVLAELDSSFPGECGPEFIVNKRDAVSKVILVEPEGFPVEVTESALLCANDVSVQNVSWNLNLPDESVVSNTEKAILYFNADLLGSTIENLEQLLNIPTGCGEQIMATLAPNLYVLKYLNATNKLSPAVKQRATRNIKIGYQKILKFMHKDGSFSAFGTQDPSGSMFLTAFVAKTLVQAKKHVYVDETVINRAVQWIFEHQLENGCFASMYHVFQDMGGTSKENSTAGLTSYVLISLKESNVNIPDSITSNAKYCIQAHRSPDKYTLAIGTYASLLMQWTDEAQRLLDRLLRELPQKFGAHTSSSVQIETMGYTLLSLVERNDDEGLAYAHAIVRWLSSKRNSVGGFKTTQDTVVALDALTRYALIVNRETNLRIRVLAANQDQEIEIGEDDRLKTRRVNLIRARNSVRVDVEGDGCVLAQAVLSYNLLNQPVGEAFKLDVEVSPVSTIDRCSIATINPCVAYAGADDVSNMAVLEVSMPSGYEPDRTSLYQLTNEPNNNIKMFEERENKVVLYFTQITDEPVCTPFIISENSVVDVRANSTIKIYDYYNPEQEVSKFYEVGVCDSKDVPSLPQIVFDKNGSEASKVVKRDMDNLNPSFKDMDVEMQMPEGNEGNFPVYMSPENTTNVTDNNVV